MESLAEDRLLCDVEAEHARLVRTPPTPPKHVAGETAQELSHDKYICRNRCTYNSGRAPVLGSLMTGINDKATDIRSPKSCSSSIASTGQSGFGFSSGDRQERNIELDKIGRAMNLLAVDMERYERRMLQQHQEDVATSQVRRATMQDEYTYLHKQQQRMQQVQQRKSSVQARALEQARMQTMSLKICAAEGLLQRVTKLTEDLGCSMSSESAYPATAYASTPVNSKANEDRTGAGKVSMAQQLAQRRAAREAQTHGAKGSKDTAIVTQQSISKQQRKAETENPRQTPQKVTNADTQRAIAETVQLYSEASAFLGQTLQQLQTANNASYEDTEAKSQENR